jgi:hypothetical protein
MARADIFPSSLYLMSGTLHQQAGTQNQGGVDCDEGAEFFQARGFEDLSDEY